MNLKKYFLNDKFILSLILLNTLLIFVQEFNIKYRLFDYLDAFFTLLFVVEMFVKISHYGFAGYIKENWNKFDFVIVLLSVPSIFLLLFKVEIIANLNFLLALRALRIFKFFRILKFVPNIVGLLKSIQRALKASYLVFIGFFVLIFIVSIITCSIFKNIAPEYFGNPFKSFYSIFRLFTIEGWYEIPDVISSRTSSSMAFWTDLYFIFLLLVGGIIGLSLVNSIFVDAMVADNNDKLEKEVDELKEKIDELLYKIDKLSNNAKDSNHSHDINL